MTKSLKCRIDCLEKQLANLKFPEITVERKVARCTYEYDISPNGNVLAVRGEGAPDLTVSFTPGTGANGAGNDYLLSFASLIPNPSLMVSVMGDISSGSSPELVDNAFIPQNVQFTSGNSATVTLYTGDDGGGEDGASRRAMTLFVNYDKSVICEVCVDGVPALLKGGCDCANNWSGQHDLLIDDWGCPQDLSVTPIDTVDQESISCATSLGGERDVYLEWLSGTAEAKIQLVIIDGERKLTLSNASNVDSQAVIIWDGSDGNASDTPTLVPGLGGIDLTVGGTLDTLAFDHFVDAAGVGTVVKFEIHDNAGNVSTATTNLFHVETTPVTFGASTIPLGSFVGPADLTDVAAIKMTVCMEASGDVVICPLGLINSSTQCCN